MGLPPSRLLLTMYLFAFICIILHYMLGFVSKNEVIKRTDKFQAFGEQSRHTDWLHNGDVCKLLNISKRTLQHYRDTGVLPFTQIGHKCYYKCEDVEVLLLTKSDKPKNRQI